MQINIENLSISYNNHTVIDKFSYTINSGEKIALVGVSGTGKTSIINAIMNLIPYEGNISFSETPRIATVFQEDRLIEELSVFTNIHMTANGLTNNEIIDYINSVGLTPRKKVSELSGGMKRRVAILRAILAPSNLLIMDEPFKGLDRTTKELIMNLISKKASDTTMIIITHDMSEATYFNSRIINIDSYVSQEPE